MFDGVHPARNKELKLPGPRLYGIPLALNLEGTGAWRGSRTVKVQRVIRSNVRPSRMLRRVSNPCPRSFKGYLKQRGGRWTKKERRSAK